MWGPRQDGLTAGGWPVTPHPARGGGAGDSGVREVRIENRGFFERLFQGIPPGPGRNAAVSVAALGVSPWRAQMALAFPSRGRTCWEKMHTPYRPR